MEWAEDSPGGAVGANGFAVLRLLADGKVCEEFYDERGALRFTKTT